MLPGQTRSRKQKSLWDDANLISKYFLFFLWPNVIRSKSEAPTLEDHYQAPKADESRRLTRRLEKNYNAQLLAGEKPSFLRAMIKTFGSDLMLIGILDIVSKCIFQPGQIVALGWLIKDSTKYLVISQTSNNATLSLVSNQTNTTPIDTNNSNSTISPLVVDAGQDISKLEAYNVIMLDAGLLILFTWLINLTSHPYFLQAYHMGLKCRIAACGLIYRKSLKLSQSAMIEATTGRLTNMLSNDVNRFDSACSMVVNLVSAPLQAAVVLILLASIYLGIFPTLACLVAIVIYVIIQSSLGRGFSKFRLLTARRTDERIRIINELIVAMRIIKMYAWEEPFKKLVERARRRELNTIAISSTFKTINQTLFFISSKIIVFASLVTFILLDYKLEPELVFVAISLANVVRISLTLFFPNAIAYVAETKVSCNRINKFLMLPEHQRSSLNYKHTNDKLGYKYAINYSKVTASWESQSGDPILENLSFSLRAGELLLVVGRVASGKSSLLMSLLGETPINAGCVQVAGRMSFCSQEPWIFPGTVRENILFGQAKEQGRYESVIKVCSLERDLEILPYGDNTIVGERGVSLSGGQKARVNLARALYYEADIYLLDDPLSAVDVPVARDIFRDAIQGFLKGKSVILATHQLQFLRQATRVLLLDREQDPVFGNLDQVCQSETFKALGFAQDAFSDAQLGRADDKTDAELKDHDAEDPAQWESGDLFSMTTTSAERKLFLVRHSLDRSIPSQTSRSYDETSSKITNESGEETGEKDTRQTGSESLTAIAANWPSYKYYIGMGFNSIGIIWFVLINIIAQTFFQYTDIFLSFWTDLVQRRDVEGAEFKPIRYTDDLTNNNLTLIYGLLVLAGFFASFLRATSLYIGSFIASINIHKSFFSCIMNAPVRFFDFNPIGILLNRLGRDIGLIDETLPLTYSDVIVIVVNVLGGIIVTIIVDSKNAIASVVLLVTALLVRSILAKSIIRLKQLEGIRGGPVFTHLSVSLSGLTTIRAFKAHEQFLKKNDNLLDKFTGVSFFCICSARLLSLAVDLLSLTFVSVVVLTTVLLNLDSTSASAIGLIVSQVIMLPGPIQWGMRQLVELESQMTSVQRIKEYSEIEPEESEEERARALMSSEQLFVPQHGAKGRIRFEDLTLRYFPDEPPVLLNLNLSIEPGEKIGIVGRTGAGKSSIIATLFRLYPFEGRILLDARDTKTLSLAQLRSSISIIPQDPILFAGSIRKNLDPFVEHGDSAIWSALTAVQLRAYFESDPLKLEANIQESGANLSVGQRQLICLARAILRRNNILILDEATANVDPETDSFIQQTIKVQFKNCTVLTIAHRLITIADSDRVLVLDQGEVKEFDEPFVLLNKESGIFKSMVESGQTQQTDRLKKTIELAHNKRRQDI